MPGTRVLTGKKPYMLLSDASLTGHSSSPAPGRNPECFRRVIPERYLPGRKARAEPKSPAFLTMYKVRMKDQNPLAFQADGFDCSREWEKGGGKSKHANWKNCSKLLTILFLFINKCFIFK